MDILSPVRQNSTDSEGYRNDSCIGLGIPIVQAQPFPNHPIQLIIANVPGAQSDISGRLLAEEMEKTLGTKIVVINKPGASGTLGTDAVVRSKKDGYTLCYTNNPAIVYARILNPEAVPYDPDKDLIVLNTDLIEPTAMAGERHYTGCPAFYANGLINLYMEIVLTLAAQYGMYVRLQDRVA